MVGTAMRKQTTMIRDPTAADEYAWRQLWSDYNVFYETNLPEAVTARTWQRMLDPASTIFGRLAVVNGVIMGFSISVLHEGTWTIAPICYLEDLFVDPKSRGCGFGRLLIHDLVDRANRKVGRAFIGIPEQTIRLAACMTNLSWQMISCVIG